jgi:mannose-6-phosphate isomerase
MEDKLPRKIEKPWGFELLLAHTPKYAGKLVFVRKGHRLSLQYHKKKDETMYIHQGKALFEIEDNDGHLVSKTLQPGQSIRIPPRTKHRLKAIEDTTFFEASTPELEDVVRLEDDYGRAKQ